MTLPGSDVDPTQLGSTPRPRRAAVVPQAIADVVGIALLGTVVLEMVAGAIQALTERAAPIFAGGQIAGLPLRVPQTSIRVSDRLSVFARAGANMAVALVLLLAIVAVLTSRHQDHSTESPVGLARALMLVSGILASVVILANVAVSIEVLRNAMGVFSGIGGTNRAASLLEFLAPVGLSIAVVWCVGTRLQSSAE
jgi:hypothetical protein